MLFYLLFFLMVEHYFLVYVDIFEWQMLNFLRKFFVCILRISVKTIDQKILEFASESLLKELGPQSGTTVWDHIVLILGL